MEPVRSVPGLEPSSQPASLAAALRTLRAIVACAIASTGSSTLHAAQPLVDDRAVTISTPADVSARRAALRAWLWGAQGLPPDLGPSHVEFDDVPPFEGLVNLARVDTFVVSMENGRQGYAHHLVPRVRGNRLVIVPLGHLPTFQDYPSAYGVDSGIQRLVDTLLGASYSVLVVYLPNTAVFSTKLRVVDAGGHWTIFDEAVSAGSPMKFFFEPIAASINYLSTRSAVEDFPVYQQFDMVGLSGGGWTTTVYAALDPRVTVSIDVAGTLPLYLRDSIEGDVEQLKPDFYSAFGYLDLYALAGAGPRRAHLQVLNRRDTCCFGQYAVRPSPATFDADVRDYERRVQQAVAGAGEGAFEVKIDEVALEHQVGAFALSSYVLPLLRPAVTLTSDRSPQVAGRTTTYTATAAGGVGPYEFAFWLYDAVRGEWRQVREYGTSNQFQWTPSQPGTYAVQAWVRTIGASIPWHGYAATNAFTVTDSPPIVLGTLSRQPSTSVRAGTEITWKVTAGGGTAPLQFQYEIVDSQGAVTERLPYGANASVAWIPSRPGTYRLRVFARSAGSTADSEATWTSDPVSVSSVAPSIVSLRPAVPLPASVGAPLRWTAVVAGDTDLDCAFWVLDPVTGWSQPKPYGPDCTWEWAPVRQGTHAIQVWARRRGTSVTYDAWRGTGWFDVRRLPLRIHSLSANQTMPLPARTPITWTPLTAGGSGPVEFKYWLFNQISGAWVVLRDWSREAALTWTPTSADAGVHAMQVWARTVGSSAAYEAYAAPGYFSVTP